MLAISTGANQGTIQGNEQLIPIIQQKQAARENAYMTAASQLGELFAAPLKEKRRLQLQEEDRDFEREKWENMQDREDSRHGQTMDRDDARYQQRLEIEQERFKAKIEAEAERQKELGKRQDRNRMLDYWDKRVVPDPSKNAENNKKVIGLYDQISKFKADPKLNDDQRAEMIKKARDQIASVQPSFMMKQAPQFSPGQGVGQAWTQPEYPGLILTRDDKGKVLFEDDPRLKIIQDVNNRLAARTDDNMKPIPYTAEDVTREVKIITDAMGMSSGSQPTGAPSQPQGGSSLLPKNQQEFQQLKADSDRATDMMKSLKSEHGDDVSTWPEKAKNVGRQAAVKKVAWMKTLMWMQGRNLTPQEADLMVPWLKLLKQGEKKGE